MECAEHYVRDWEVRMKCMRLNDTLDPELRAFSGGSGREVHMETQTQTLWGLRVGVNKPGVPAFWAEEGRKGTPHQNH